MQYGSEEQKQTLLLMMQNEELQRIRELVAMGIFFEYLLARFVKASFL